MWQFISQNWWIFLFVGMMFFMHRPGGAGCCGGGHQHGQGPNGQDHDPQSENTGGTGDHHHGQSTISPLEPKNKARLQD